MEFPSQLQPRPDSTFPVLFSTADLFGPLEESSDLSTVAKHEQDGTDSSVRSSGKPASTCIEKQSATIFTDRRGSRQNCVILDLAQWLATAHI